jgi:hypothetical protein
VRRRGQKDHPAIRIPRQTLQETEALLPTLVRSDARVGLIDDDEIRAGAREAFAAFFCLDVVEADDREWISLEQGLGERQPAF